MKKLIFIAVLQFLLSTLLIAQTVYFTKSGKKYHSSNCTYLKSSATSISLSEAIQKGYSPCSRCNPPTTVDGTSKNNQSQLFKDSNLNNTSNNKTSTSKQCIAITKKGIQCSRNAEEGSNYCWQHSKTKPTIKSESKNYNMNSSGRTIYTGPRGGKYYINSKGNKVYIKRK